MIYKIHSKKLTQAVKLMPKNKGGKTKLKRLTTSLTMDKKGILRIDEETKSKLMKIRRNHNYSVESMGNHLLNKVIAGDYDYIKAKDKKQNKTMNVDHEIWVKARAKADELGFSSLNQMIKQIADDEYTLHIADVEYQKMFESVGNQQNIAKQSSFFEQNMLEEHKKELRKGMC